jgi:hypothetical protein
MSPTSDLTLSDWNWAVLMLTQAMIGAVSPNFRLVELAFEHKTWVVRVTLREESKADREEIDEICDEFSIFLEDVRDPICSRAYARIVPDVTVSQDPIILSPAAPTRYVFRMRES